MDDLGIGLLLNRYSAKRNAIRPERARLRQAILGQRPWCECCGASPSQDAHEIVTRARGGSILDPNNILALCRPCHEWIGNHPKDAQECGLIAPSWASNALSEAARARKARWFGMPIVPEYAA